MTRLSFVSFLSWCVAGFVVMEPVTYCVHRWVMHGPGWGLHASHHRTRPHRWERNDLFPVMFAIAVGTVMFAGFNVPGAGSLVALSVGVTLYGAAYALVHDVYVHRRLGNLGDARLAPLEFLGQRHQLHHRFGGEPYGMLAPLLPRRAGSRPSHVPAHR